MLTKRQRINKQSRRFLLRVLRCKGPGDVPALVDRLVRLANDPNELCQMGQAARRRVECDYAVEVMVQRVAAVYDEVWPQSSS